MVSPYQTHINTFVKNAEKDLLFEGKYNIEQFYSMEKQNNKLTGWKDFVALLITFFSAYTVGYLLVILIGVLGYPQLGAIVGLVSGAFIVGLGISISNGKSFKSTIQDTSKETVNLIYVIGISIIAICVLALILLIFFGIFSWISSLPATTIIIVLLVLLLLKK